MPTSAKSPSMATALPNPLSAMFSQPAVAGSSFDRVLPSVALPHKEMSATQIG